MSQFGASTTIGDEVKLVISDCFETLVKMTHESYEARKGVLELLLHITEERGLPLVVHSDAQLHQIEHALEQAELQRFVQRIFHAGDALETLPDGQVRKRLDITLAAYGMQANDVIFIGDSPFDAAAAQFYGTPFIRVPRSEDVKFDFSHLIHGPSRYNSGEFSRTMLEFYLKQKPAD